MIPSDFARAVLKDLDEDIVSRTSALAEGAFNTLEGYREAVGARRGLMIARALVIKRLAGEAPEAAREFGG